MSENHIDTTIKSYIEDFHVDLDSVNMFAFLGAWMASGPLLFRAWLPMRNCADGPLDLWCNRSLPSPRLYTCPIPRTIQLQGLRFHGSPRQVHLSLVGRYVASRTSWIPLVACQPFQSMPTLTKRLTHASGRTRRKCVEATYSTHRVFNSVPSWCSRPST